jgi:hypothetical protein
MPGRTRKMRIPAYATTRSRQLIALLVLAIAPVVDADPLEEEALRPAPRTPSTIREA